MRRKAVKALVMHTKDSIRHLKDDDDEMLRGQRFERLCLSDVSDICLHVQSHGLFAELSPCCCMVLWPFQVKRFASSTLLSAGYGPDPFWMYT